ncbi:MAG: glycosyltransferase family 4 protein [Elusimicrobia bacterium]|nr:glycosyltransferase family 4 protein [Elusimicrobiota bacterium]
MARLRVGVACRSISGVTGTTTGILEHAKRMAARGWDVHLIGETLDKPRVREAGASAHTLFRLPFLRKLRRRFFARQADRALARGRFDWTVGHGDNLHQDSLALHNCVHLAHELIHGKPLPGDSTVGRLHAHVLREKSFKVLVANSRLMADDVASRWGIEPARIRVIHPGYDPTRFKAEDRPRLGRALREKLGVAEGAVLVGLVTSGDFQKRGVGLFLKALARLSAAAKGRTHALVVGQETRLGSYRGLAQETGLGERLKFLPPERDVAPYYHALDVYAFPALIEEFGQSVQEAMACGVAVVTSARVGASELVTGPARSILLEAPEEKAFSAKMQSLILDSGLRRAWAAIGLDAARGNTWDENFKKTLACYEEFGLKTGATR